MPEETKPLPYVRCPHCGSDLIVVEHRVYGPVVIIACGQCLKVIAGSFHPEQRDGRTDTHQP